MRWETFGLDIMRRLSYGWAMAQNILPKENGEAWLENQTLQGNRKIGRPYGKSRYRLKFVFSCGVWLDNLAIR